MNVPERLWIFCADCQRDTHHVFLGIEPEAVRLHATQLHRYSCQECFSLGYLCPVEFTWEHIDTSRNR